MREFLSLLIMPIPVLFLLILAGVFFLWRKRKRSGEILLLVAGCWLLVISTRPIPEALVKHLEDKYHQLSEAQINELPDSVNIIVLGGGHADDPGLSPNDQLSTIALGRLVEGVRIYKMAEGRRRKAKGEEAQVEWLRAQLVPTCREGPEQSASAKDPLPGGGRGGLKKTITDVKVIVSGYGGRSKVSQAEVLYKTALMLGIDSSVLIMSPKPANTMEEAVEYKKICGVKTKVIIVTDAIHMPRAMLLFKQAGLDPVPAPTNHLIKHGTVRNPWRWVPSAGNIQKMEKAMHEYAGILWFKLRHKGR